MIVAKKSGPAWLLRASLSYSGKQDRKAWRQSNLLSEPFSNFNPDVFPDERKDGYGITVNRGDDYANLKAGHGIKEGDFKNYHVVTVTDDDSFTLPSIVSK